MERKDPAYRFVLASGSPRRREILKKAGIDYEVIPADVEEQTEETEPAKIVMDLSRQKAGAVFRELSGESDGRELVVIGADTLVARDGKILGKPKDREQAIAMIRLLEGRSHEVVTGVTLLSGSPEHPVRRTFFERTLVAVYPMTEAQIEAYVDTGEPYDKAGGYGIQGAFAVWVRGIRGDYNNVVGLPLARLCLEMREAGFLR